MSFKSIDLINSGFKYLGKSQKGLKIFKKASENMAETRFVMLDSLDNIVRGCARDVNRYRSMNANVNSSIWRFTEKDVLQKMTNSKPFETICDKYYSAQLNDPLYHFGYGPVDSVLIEQISKTDRSFFFKIIKFDGE